MVIFGSGLTCQIPGWMYLDVTLGGTLARLYGEDELVRSRSSAGASGVSGRDALDYHMGLIIGGVGRFGGLWTNGCHDIYL